jgi:glutamyl-tRNA synthetase
VIRFRNPDEGSVVWDDAVKGTVAIANTELDDLVIARADGTPTYNFCVVVDDLDMRITHVIRGDDHVNNTPRQINILRALIASSGGELPRYGHVPMILGPDGDKLSKRHGAVSVTQYRDAGYLPEAMVNYLARLGWSHGDAELFDRRQLIEWFDGSHLSRSAAQWDVVKLDWVNAHYMKAADDARLAALVDHELASRGIVVDGDPALQPRRCALFKDRAATVVELADLLGMYFVPVTPREEDLRAHVNDASRAALAVLARRLEAIDWNKQAIGAAIKETLAECGLKMAQLAPPLRVLVCGRAQTPSIDAVLELFERSRALGRLTAALA